GGVGLRQSLVAPKTPNSFSCMLFLHMHAYSVKTQHCQVVGQFEFALKGRGFSRQLCKLIHYPSPTSPGVKRVNSSPNGFGGGRFLSLPTPEEQAEFDTEKPHCA